MVDEKVENDDIDTFNPVDLTSYPIDSPQQVISDLVDVEKEININFCLEGLDSKDVYGLKAVDFFSWSVFRKFEYSDNRFFNLILEKLKRRREWYVD